MVQSPVRGWSQVHRGDAAGRLLPVFGRGKRRTRPAEGDADYARAVAHLTQSRRTIVEAFEIERARIERDLHDGAQQYLVAASMKVGEALLALDGLRAQADTPQLAALSRLLAEALDDTDGALHALRETVAGVHSRTLAERGLEAAVRELGERLSTPASPIEVRVPHPLPALPDGVLSTAWFFASEALTNAIKHAPGAHVSVVVVADTTLHVSVVDDGPGGARWRPGHGLAGLRERLATFGGALTLTSPPGGPTTVAARIPLLLRPGEVGIAMGSDELGERGVR